MRDQDGRAKLYADIAHPINSQCREMIQRHVIEEYRGEVQRATQPDYVSRYDDDYDDSDEVSDSELDSVSRKEPIKRIVTEHAHIEPAEVEPRPPHRPPSQTPTKRTPPRESDQFGAGIFE